MRQESSFGASPLAFRLTTRGELECYAVVHPLRPEISTRRDGLPPVVFFAPPQIAVAIDDGGDVGGGGGGDGGANVIEDEDDTEEDEEEDEEGDEEDEEEDEDETEDDEEGEDEEDEEDEEEEEVEAEQPSGGMGGGAAGNNVSETVLETCAKLMFCFGFGLVASYWRHMCRIYRARGKKGSSCCLIRCVSCFCCFWCIQSRTLFAFVKDRQTRTHSQPASKLD